MSLSADPDELIDQAKLLRDVFPNAGLSLEYLEWLYRRSPDGSYLATDFTESGRLLGHYSVVPQYWRIAGETRRLALSLNTAVHHDARGKGLFVQLAEETYAKAMMNSVHAIVGVANANSTPGFLRRLGFTLVTPLPVVAGFVFPTRPRTTASYTLDASFLASEKFTQIVARLDTGVDKEMEQAWSAAKLRWRLSSPRTRYALHTDESGILITTASRHLGLPIVVALKFIPNIGARRMNVKRLLRQAASHHKTPVFIYCGFNNRALVKGAPLPRRILPSPLNLIYRRLEPSMPEPSDVRFGVFEFLDFDAY